MSDRNDSDAVRRLAGGDRAAFDELYRKYYRRLCGFCYRLLGDRDAVEDIVQSVFVRALESVKSLENPELFYSWLFTIARNEVYGTFRSGQKDGAASLEDDVWDPDTPHEHLVRSEAKQLVEEGIRRLKPEYREVLILRHFEKLSYAEISSITGDSISSVESRLFKARKALIKYFEPYMREGGVS